LTASAVRAFCERKNIEQSVNTKSAKDYFLPVSTAFAPAKANERKINFLIFSFLARFFLFA